MSVYFVDSRHLAVDNSLCGAVQGNQLRAALSICSYHYR